MRKLVEAFRQCLDPRPGVSFRRISNVAGVACLVAALLVLCAQAAHAQTVACTNVGAQVTAGADMGYVFTATPDWSAGGVCAQENTRLGQNGYGLQNCTETATAFTGDVMNPDGSLYGSRTYGRLPLGCTPATSGGGTGGTSGTVNGTVTLVLPRAFSLSASEGLLLGFAILGVWAAAALWRWSWRALSVADTDHDE